MNGATMLPRRKTPPSNSITRSWYWRATSVNAGSPASSSPGAQIASDARQPRSAPADERRRHEARRAQHARGEDQRDERVDVNVDASR